MIKSLELRTSLVDLVFSIIKKDGKLLPVRTLDDLTLPSGIWYLVSGILLLRLLLVHT